MSCSCILCTTIKSPLRKSPAGGGGGVAGGGSGGSDFTLPVSTIEDKHRGLGKAQRLAQERTDAVKDDAIPRLNPPFPYRVIPPPLEYFRFPANPPETWAGG